jgi:crotonobetainyl-CoA:carnitine CoA-transferase CaiB-like acyl-CoA transferase
VDISMLDSTVFSMVPREGYYFSTGRTPERLGNAHYQIVPWNTFATSDDRHLMVVAHTEKFWRSLAQAVGRESLLADARFVSATLRRENREALDAQLAEVFREDTLDAWCQRLEAAGALFAPVRDFEQVFSDPAVQKMVQTVDHPTAGPVQVLRNPMRMSASDVSIRRAPPLLGEHTEQVMLELAAGSLH